MTIKSYRDLIVWQKAMDLVEEIYRCSQGFPNDERFGLTAQLRRAAVSVPSNIAEGNSRGTSRDYLRFLDMSYGSLAEVETQVMIANRLNYLDSPKLEDLLQRTGEIGRLINGLQRSLAAKEARKPPL